MCTQNLHKLVSALSIRVHAFFLKFVFASASFTVFGGGRVSGPSDGRTPGTIMEVSESIPEDAEDTNMHNFPKESGE